jgi:hypothetical protein
MTFKNNFMQLPRIIWSAILGIAAISGGCASTATIDQHTTLTPAEVSQIKKDQAIRLTGPQNQTAGQVLANSGVFAPVVAVGMITNAIVFEPIGAGWANLTGDTVNQAAIKMVQTDNPDDSRQGIYRLGQFMQNTGPNDAYTDYMLLLADGAKDYTVRAAAIRVLNEYRIRKVVPAAIRNLEYPEPLVRLEAAKALANIPDSSALTTLVKHLQSDTNADVRIACADALRNFDVAPSTNALTDTLGDKDFSVAHQSHESLRIISFHDFQYDRAQWQDYFSPALRSTH